MRSPARRRHAGLALAACACLSLPCCIQLRWTARNIDDRLSQAAIESMWPGTDTLQSALGKLGAPHHVWEYQREGIALAWVQQEEEDLGLRVSYAVSRGPSASFRFDDSQLDVPGVVLWFDGQLVLEKVRQGNLRDLTEDLTRPPAAPDDATQGARD